MKTIERIEHAGPDRKARRLFFSDGTEILTSAAVVRALDLEVGAHVDLAELHERELGVARERALWLLGYRERSQRELTRRLKDDGYPAECVDQIVCRFVDLQLVDDARFAQQWARTRMASGLGASRIKRELAEKGVAANVIATALQECDAAESEFERAQQVLRGRVPQDAKERDRLIRRLVTRGFSLSVALEVVPRISRCDSDDDPTPHD